MSARSFSALTAKSVSSLSRRCPSLAGLCYDLERWVQILSVLGGCAYKAESTKQPSSRMRVPAFHRDQGCMSHLCSHQGLIGVLRVKIFKFIALIFRAPLFWNQSPEHGITNVLQLKMQSPLRPTTLLTTKCCLILNSQLLLPASEREGNLFLFC